jgi:hypothetical protein
MKNTPRTLGINQWDITFALMLPIPYTRVSLKAESLFSKDKLQ